MIELCRDTVVEGTAEARDARELLELARRTEKTARDLRLAVGLKETRVPASAMSGNAEFAAALGELRRAVANLARALAALAERGEGLANCTRRATELAERLDRWADGARDDVVRWLEAEHSRARAPRDAARGRRAVPPAAR